MHHSFTSKIASGVIAAFIAVESLCPALSVMADEIEQTEPTEPVIEVTEETAEPEVVPDAEPSVTDIPDSVIPEPCEETEAPEPQPEYEFSDEDIFTLCGTYTDIAYETIDPAATVKVAVIDTGSNNANEAVSVISDDGSDSNGHGTNVCNYILANSESAYILSIKAVSDDGTAKAADVYEAIQYAMDSNADIILLAMSAKDSESLSELKALIEAAISGGITVIAAAGNNNQDASGYVPANIPGVITVGAIDADGYKQPNSNYGSCVDYYVEADTTSQAASIFTGIYISGNASNTATSYKTLEPENTYSEDISEDGTLAIEITPVYVYDDNGFVINGTTVTGNHVRVTWSFGTHYWSSVERAQHRSSILNEISGIDGISNVEVTFYPQATSANYSGSQGGYQTDQVLVEFDVESIQDIVGGGSFYNAVTSLNSKGNKSYGGGVVVINWSTVAQQINTNEFNNANNSGYTVQTQNGWVRRVCHGPYNRPNIGSTTYCSDPGQAFNDNYTVTVYGSDTSGDVPVAALGGYMAQSAARVLSSSQSGQAKQGFVWSCKGLSIATAVATDPGDDAFPVETYDGGTVSLNMTTSSPFVDGKLFAVPGQSYTFTDSNGQIGNYTASSSYSGVTATINGNDLIISVAADADPAQILNTTISLECGSGYDGPVETVWHLYVYESSGQDQVNADYKRQKAHYNAEPWSVGLISELELDITKSSANTAIVSNNACYELSGTSYGLYTSDGTLVHTFYIDSSGNTDSYKITDLSKSYCLKEITAGKGYELDPKTYEVKITDAIQGKISYEFKDTPLSDPLNWSLVKLDNKGFNNVTGLTLAGATFNVSYYDTTDVTSLSQALALTDPYESVNLKTATDASGAAKITVSSTSLSAVSNYFNSFSSKRELPLGTYVVREVSAPTGYNPVPTNSVYVLVLYQGSDGKTHKARYSSNQYFYSLTEEMAQVYEPPKTGKAKFYKESTVNTNLATAAPTLYDLAGTKYEIYYTDSGNLACTVTFGSNGKMTSAVYPAGVNGTFNPDAQTVELPIGSYYAKEVQTGKGYYLNPDAQSFTVTEGNTASVVFDDEPMYADFELVLEKLVTATGITQDAADLYSVEGAVFSVNYYNKIVPESDLATTTPTKSWFFKTDADGKIFYTNKYLTSTSYYLDEQGIITLFRDANGNYVAPQGTYTITEITPPENLDLNPTTYVRYLTLGNNIVKGSSEDPANKDAWTLTLDGEILVPETPFVPTIDTVAMASDGSKELAAAPDQKITDTVTVMNLISGYEYKVKGELYLTDGTPLGVTAEKTVTFTTAGSTSGSFDMEFTVDCTGLDGKTIVVTEDLYVIDKDGNEVLFVSHDDLHDTDQQVTIPAIATTLLDTAIDTWTGTYTNSQGYTKHVSYGTKVTLTDYVTYSNLVVGYEYTVTGTLKNKDTGEDILDNNGNPITGSVTFTATSSDGYVEVLFENVDTTKFSGISVVAFEDLSRNGINLVSHADLTDAEQTLPAPPEIQTKASQEASALYSEKITIVDTVSYTGLVPGKEYTVTGSLYNADTGAILKDKDGKAITASTTFTAKSAEGTVDVIFEDAYIPLAVEKVVVFENLYYNGIRIAVHEDLEDKDQTITFPVPEIKTNAADSDTETQVLSYSEYVTITDEVTYTGLIEGVTYKVTGNLVDADTGESLKDEDGKVIEASTTFTAKASEGSIEVVFEDVYVPYTVTKVVVFETLYYNKTKIAIHADIEDENQTVRRAAASTMATTDTGDKTVVVGADANIVDTITYTGLETGKQYKAVGELYKKDGTQLLYPDGTPVTSEVVFVPEAPDGTVTVTFTLNTEGFTEEDSVVVFETVYDVAEDTETQTEDVIVAEHKDLEDADQTITFVMPVIPEIPEIPATGEGTPIAAVTGLALIATNIALIWYNLKKRNKRK